MIKARKTTIAQFLIVAALFFHSISVHAQSSQRGPSTPEERTRVVEVAHRLQANPLAPEVRSEREWLLVWFIQAPDISVSLCPALHGDLGDSKGTNAGAIIATELASEAAFVIEHPDQAKDHAAIFFAGAEGAFHA
jgi:carboxypeptidase Q